MKFSVRIWKRVSQDLILFVACIFSCLIYNTQCVCELTPAGISKTRDRLSVGRYIIDIPGKPQNYIPLQKYNISLKSNPEMFPRRTFKSFILTISPADAETDENSVGQLELESGFEMLTRFSSVCPNTVIESNSVPKTGIQVYWTAPPTNSGCVAIKATVVESKESWFSEDGPLTKRLCEETAVDENIQPEIQRRCCACQEAKYEIAFEGKWTRNTHPRHFPSDLWNTRFSDIVGASHRLHHAFWDYDSFASDGLRELAETGVTKTLESELKNNSQHIRTIIKARGLHYPNITKSTYAVFRVDPRNHLVSIVSKITPSPDWVVGVSNLELCTSDCTWEESRTLNLYPWDVGTNDGLDYTSSVPTFEKQPIRRITPNNPNHPSSPFYSDQGEEIKPIAKLHLTRQRLYNKTCDETSAEEQISCATTEWSEWSSCSERCGKGLMFRQRKFVIESEDDKCNVDLLDIKDCYGYSKRCRNIERAKLETTTISSEGPETEPTTQIESETTPTIDEECPETHWGPWSKCNVNCGRGNKTRIRLLKDGLQLTEDVAPNCFGSETVECVALCSEDEETSAFTPESFIVSQGPTGRVVNCKVSGWSKWSPCLLDGKEEMCGEGYKYKERRILRHPENGGIACPPELRKLKICTVDCPQLPLNECIMGRWSHWTPCSSNCGESAVQIRTRNITYQPPGVDCSDEREERKKCDLPIACDGNGQPIF